MFLKVMISFVLCYVVGVLPAVAEISNHHIFYRKDKRAPVTSIEIVFLGAGSKQEQPSQTGLAVAVSKLIQEVAKKHGYMDQLEALGTRLNTSTRTLYHTISIYGLSENCAESIEIVRDLICNLEFSESDLRHGKKMMVTDYQNYLRRDPHPLMRNFAVAKTKGIKRLKSLKTLQDLSLKDIRQYYDRFLKTDVVFFKIISNRDSIEVAKWLRPITEERETGGFVHSLKFPTTDYSVGPSAFVFNSNVKSVFCHWLIPCGDISEESTISTLISDVLLDDAQGLIHRYFRQELGLVYGPSCQVRWSEGVRYLYIYADPQLHNSAELIVKMSDFVRGLSDNPRFWESLKERREIFKVSYVHNQTPRRSLDREVSRAVYNRPTRKGGYDSVTDAEVRAFLEKFFVPENMIMIFAGPKDHITGILNKHWPEIEVHEQSTQSLIE